MDLKGSICSMENNKEMIIIDQVRDEEGRNLINGSQCKEISRCEKCLKGKIYRTSWLTEYGGEGE